MNDAFSEFFKLGVQAAMLWWFATRMERRLEALEESNDRGTRASLLQTITMGRQDDIIKQQAQQMLHDMDQRRDEK